MALATENSRIEQSGIGLPLRADSGFTVRSPQSCSLMVRASVMTAVCRAYMVPRRCLFPPFARKAELSPAELFPSYVHGAAAWFEHVYPRTQTAEWRGPTPIEVVQQAGETVYVPAGWWHVVINVDCTVAVTQNFGDRRNFDGVAEAIRRKRSDVSAKWLERAARLKGSR